MLRPDNGADPRRSSRILERWFGGVIRREDFVVLQGPAEAVSIAIGSGKGGTGKSFLATNLAVVASHSRPEPRFTRPALAASSRRRVGLVDFDFGLACDHLLLGVRPSKTLQHVVSGGARFVDVMVATEFGPTLVPGGSGVQRMANLGRAELARLGIELGEFVQQQDLVFLDIGAGISPQTVLPLTCADHVVLVTQPEIAALTDAYAVIKCLSAQCRRSPFAIVVNRVVDAGQGRRTFEKLAEVTRRFIGVELHYLGAVAEDSAVTQRRWGQPPIVWSDPQCEISRSIRKILDRLRTIVGPLHGRPTAIGVGMAARFHAAIEHLF